MNKKIVSLIQTLAQEHRLSLAEYELLLRERDEEATRRLRDLAVSARKQVYGNTVYIRGLIEISNICKRNCYYCGIRRDNSACERYRLTEAEILECCAEGYQLGFRTFVLQGGEDGYWTDERLCSLLRSIKTSYPDCAVTLSLGERTQESYLALYEAGADRYLLRHETADPKHYGRLHPAEMSFAHRMSCLQDLREIGYQVGCGFMVDSPYQTDALLAKDLHFIQEFHPDMCGIGPFLPHPQTPLWNFSGGTVEKTCYLLSILRLIHPDMLLPSTTALATLHPQGRLWGIQAGANVVMPNLSPLSVRKKYEIYQNKAGTGEESAQGKRALENSLLSIGYQIVTERGDKKHI